MDNKGFINNYPIILVHGFLGWGREEMAGYKYWGGEDDIQSILNDSHYRTYTAVVGPLSSNWERAVDLYYYIVGGTVDYGAAHAEKYNIKRFGHTYQGIYPLISNKNKIHLVGHSMGGLTIRLFEKLLREGSEEEREYSRKNPEIEVSDLFLGDKKWVHSLTSLSTPHNSGTILTQPGAGGKIFYPLVMEIAALAGINHVNFLYDFKLDQWGLKREKGEYFLEYLERVMESDMWKSNNTAWYDMSMEKTAKLNQITGPYPDSFYLSFYSNTTFKNPATGHYLPEITTSIPFLYDAYETGKFSGSDVLPGGDISWRVSDGVVNVPSGKSPFGHPSKEVLRDDPKFEPGIWNVFPEIHGLDHMQMIGVQIGARILKKDVIPFYKELAEILVRLEKGAVIANNDSQKKKEQSEDTKTPARKTKNTSKSTTKKRTTSIKK